MSTQSVTAALLYHLKPPPLQRCAQHTGRQACAAHLRCRAQQRSAPGQGAAHHSRSLPQPDLWALSPWTRAWLATASPCCPLHRWHARRVAPRMLLSRHAWKRRQLPPRPHRIAHQLSPSRPRRHGPHFSATARRGGLHEPVEPAAIGTARVTAHAHAKQPPPRRLVSSTARLCSQAHPVPAAQLLFACSTHRRHCTRAPDFLVPQTSLNCRHAVKYTIDHGSADRR